MKISFIMPGRNNRRYAEWSYASIQKHKGDHEVQICFADDASTDGTWEWCENLMKLDPNFNAIQNTSGKRLGHTILYDTLIYQVAKHELCIIWHCDMYLCPGALDALEQHMYKENAPQKNLIVSLTRIEPPLHPQGPEKILADFGVEPETFDEVTLLRMIPSYKTDTVTEGIFAPWCFWKDEFQAIGGHDPLFAPQSKEDSDIFNRFMLNGVRFIQTWSGYVYHMTCRGSRRNTLDQAATIYEDSPEWLEQNYRSARNFIRKWGHFVMHDEYMKPIVLPKYDIGIKVTHCTLPMLEILEPWCSNIYIDDENQVITIAYLEKEAQNTLYDLKSKISSSPFSNPLNNDVVVEVDVHTMTDNDLFYIGKLPVILSEQQPELGSFQLGNCIVRVNRKLKDYSHSLIKL